MNDEQTSYKVTDRRLFNADGTPRDVPESERPEPTPEKPEPVSTAASTVPESSANADAGAAQPGVKTEAPAASAEEAGAASVETDTGNVEGDLPDAEDPASFASFMMSIASNAASSLGMMEHPVTHKREVDLELGKHWIDVLGMLQQKTRGNLLPQEQQILEGLLADLRMQFVSLTNATPKARSFSSQDITGG
jgi:hypothetical protein